MVTKVTYSIPKNKTKSHHTNKHPASLILRSQLTVRRPLTLNLAHNSPSGIGELLKLITVSYKLDGTSWARQIKRVPPFMSSPSSDRACSASPRSLTRWGLSFSSMRWMSRSSLKTLIKQIRKSQDSRKMPRSWRSKSRIERRRWKGFKVNLLCANKS